MQVLYKKTTEDSLVVGAWEERTERKKEITDIPYFKSKLDTWDIRREQRRRKKEEEKE